MNNQPTPQGGPRPVFDVTRPGRTPASPNSRPVIMNRRPPVQDTSVTKSAPVSSPQPMMNPKEKITVQPSSPNIPSSTVNSGRPAPVKLDRPTPPRPQQPLPVVDKTQPRQQLDVAGSEEHYDLPAQKGGKHSVVSEVLAISAIVLLVLVILNILLDADIINWPVPHTNFFDY